MTRFLSGIWLVLLLLSASAAGQDGSATKVKLRVYPPDVEVLRVTATPRDADGDGEPDYEPLRQDRSIPGQCFVEIPLEDARSTFYFTFRRKGFKFDKNYGWGEEGMPTLSNGALVDVYPPEDEPAIKGRPDNLWVAATTYARFHPWLLAGPGLVLVAIGAGLTWVRRERLLVQAHARKREALTAQFDGTDPLVGKTLGKYLVIDRLGEGGMATVYKAVPEATLELKDTVAIKIMQTKMADDPEFRRRFQREVQVSKDLQHPNIVRVDDWGEQDGMLYLVLEYVPGETLERRIPRQGMSLEEALPFLEPIIEALIYAHGRGVVHRDLKPENIMVTKMGALKVMDFGLARSNDVSKVTKTGSALGTPAYMPPEQITGAAPRPASDQYAFAVMTYEILTGRRPFDDGDMMSILFKHMSERPPSPREWKPSISEGMEKLILRMLEKEPNRRLPSMELVREALQALAAGRSWEPPAMPPGPPSRKLPAQTSTTGDTAAPEGEGALQALSAQDNEGTVGFQALAPQDQPDSDGTVAFQSLSASEQKKEGD
jgi:serine/threonine protein kinase